MNLNLNLDPNILKGFIEVMAALLLKTALAIWLAVKKGEFKWVETPRFLYTNVLPYGGGLLAWGLFSTINPILYAGYFIIVGALNIKYGKEAWEYIKGLNEVELPDFPAK